MRVAPSIRSLLLAFVLLAPGGCTGPNVDVPDTQVEIISERRGSGLGAKEGDRVTVAYRLALPDGTEVLRADESSFTVGGGTVIQGLDMGVRGMRRGGRRTFQCPPQLHWGRQGYGNIPPSTTLRIDVEMKRIR